jgi:hypothetical protein
MGQLLLKKYSAAVETITQRRGLQTLSASIVQHPSPGFALALPISAEVPLELIVVESLKP